MHYKTRPRNQLNERQRQVLDLLARGFTNAEIAEALDMSLNGAKWHVSEILAAWEFESRDEAARYWRHEHGLVRRCQRAARSLVAPLFFHPATAAVAVLAVGAVAAGGVYAFAHTSSGQQALPPTAPPPVVTATPVLEGPVVQDPSIRQVQMVGISSGWAFEGNPDLPPANDLALRTDDGARTWHATTHPWPANAVLATAAAIDRQHAWVVTMTPAPAAATPGAGSDVLAVWRTTDGGQTWESAAVPEGGPSEITFIDAQHGWMLQGRGAGAGSEGVAILRTIDGGASWTEAAVTQGTADAPPLQCIKSGISFVTPLDGWVAGDCAGGAPYLYASHDGGTTWAQVSLPSPDKQGTDIVSCLCNVTAPVFPTVRDGYFVLSGEQTAIYATHDGGATWTALAPPAASPALLGKPAFSGANDGWLTNGKALYVTHDAARTWTLLNTNLPLSNPPVLDFVNKTDGWAAISTGNGVQVWHTTDGGLTWTIATADEAPSATP